jgi:excisionase family DNA binding protein
MTKIKSNGSNLRTAVACFFTISDVANFLNVSTRTVRRWIKEGLLVAHRINGVVRISETDLAAFLAAFRDR